MLKQKVEQTVRTAFEGEGSGHDWWHVDRVRNTALTLAREECADLLIVELAALTHDVGDSKFRGGDETAGPREVTKLLQDCGAPPEVVDRVVEIVSTVSFKGAGVPTPMRTLEGQCVQDADRLDAIGAIGIARCFAYGGHVGRPLHVPGETATLHLTSAAYKSNQSSSLAHFHEKLYLLEARMNTSAAKRMAKHRTKVLQDFEAEFLAQWQGHR
jgi:uncharacterized protein